MRKRYGFTLTELVVVVAIIAIVSSVSGAMLTRLMRTDALPTPASRVRDARWTALRSGQLTTVVDSAPGRAPWRATAYPDGRVVADTAFGIDMLTGAPRMDVAEDGA